MAHLSLKTLVHRHSRKEHTADCWDKCQGAISLDFAQVLDPTYMEGASILAENQPKEETARHGVLFEAEPAEMASLVSDLRNEARSAMALQIHRQNCQSIGLDSQFEGLGMPQV